MGVKGSDALTERVFAGPGPQREGSRSIRSFGIISHKKNLKKRKFFFCDRSMFSFD
jgi:hypothetical protein